MSPPEELRIHTRLPLYFKSFHRVDMHGTAHSNINALFTPSNELIHWEQKKEKIADNNIGVRRSRN